MNRLKQSGFSIVEFMVMISLIIILVAVAAVAAEAVFKNSRDRQRVVTLHRLQQSLENYYTENGFYVCGQYCPSSGSGDPLANDAYGNDGAQFDFVAGGNYVADDSFLNGGDCCGALAPYDTGTSDDGLTDQGFEATATTTEPAGINNVNGLFYEYAVRRDKRQEYRLYAHLEGDTELMENDGGWCRNYFELFSEKRDGAKWDYEPQSGPGVCLPNL